MKIPKFFPKLQACQNFPDRSLKTAFDLATNQLDIKNIFNPSFFINQKIKIFSFRAITNGETKLRCFLSIQSESGHTIRDFSDFSDKLLGTRDLIDPKIFQINDEIYVSLHTGWAPEGNDMYVMKVYPELGNLKRIIYNNRQSQERNWAFFSEEQQVYALYSIKPLRILKLDRSSSDSWEFTDYYTDTIRDRSFSNSFTIGTQMAKYQDKYFFIAHRKIKLINKKLYLGKACLFDFNNKKIEQSSCLLVHSFKSLLGSKIKHNSNLFSCTYFSGLQISDNQIRIGYGINDTESGFTQYPEEWLKFN